MKRNRSAALDQLATEIIRGKRNPSTLKRKPKNLRPDRGIRRDAELSAIEDWRRRFPDGTIKLMFNSDNFDVWSIGGNIVTIGCEYPGERPVETQQT